MIEFYCLCGQIRVEIAGRPDFVHACNCTLCGKTGARWGYFPPSDVRIDGATRGYRRADKQEASAEIRFCETCGVTTHFRLTPEAVAKFGDTMMGVNMALADQRDLAGVELRFPDGRAWDGASAFGYVRAARVIGAETGLD